MKITIEATKEEVKELLQTIASSQEQDAKIEYLEQKLDSLESKINLIQLR